MPNTEVAPVPNLTNGRNYFSVVDIDFLLLPDLMPAKLGSGVILGNGIILTASHVIGSGGVLGNPLYYGNQFGISFAEGEEWGAVGGNIDIPNLPLTTSNIYNIGNYQGFFSTSNSGTDIGLIRTDPNFSQSIPNNPMIVFFDPNEASGALWSAGYPHANPSFPGANHENMFETTGTLSTNSYLTSPTPNDGFVWLVDPTTGYETGVGQSGSGVWLTPDGIANSQSYLAGIHTGFISSGGSFVGFGTVEPISDIYQALASQLDVFFGPNFGSLFATNVLIADQDGSVTNVVQGTGFNEDIYINSTVGITADGGGGFNTVNYASVSGGINFLQGPNSISALRDNGATDTLSNINYIIGSVFADTFEINNFLINQSLETIVGNSPVPPFAEPLDKNGDTLESPDGGRNLSAAEAVAASGQLHMITGDEDTISVSQALFDAGAEVTYLTAQGEGAIWLEQNGVTQMITYTGIFNEVQQTEFFGGLPNGTVTGLNDIGGVVLDFSGSDTPIDAGVLTGITLFNLVDEFIGSDLGDTIDLASTRLARVGYMSAVNDNCDTRLAA